MKQMIHFKNKLGYMISLFQMCAHKQVLASLASANQYHK